MLPTPAALREQSALYREAARNSDSVEVKRLFANYALALAQVAEGIERDKENSKVEQLERTLADAISTVMQALQAIRATREQVRRWRARAQELRTAADQFDVPSAQASLRRSAADCDRLAHHAEALLTDHSAAAEAADP